MRIHSTLGVLRRNRDQIFAIRQWGREIVESSVIADERHLFAIHHDACPCLSLARNFDDMPMLYQGIDFERQFPGRNDRR